MKSKLCEKIIISFYTKMIKLSYLSLSIFVVFKYLLRWRALDPSSKFENLCITRIGSYYAKIDETLQHRVSRSSEDTFATIIISPPLFVYHPSLLSSPSYYYPFPLAIFFIAPICSKIILPSSFIVCCNI